MKFEYGKAPIKYIDNIPSHKAGEWPGIKPCKFHSYKRVIRPTNCGIIYNENEPPLPPKRKLLGPTQPTPEYIFKPCCKMVAEQNNHIDKPQGLRYIPFDSKEAKPRAEKRHEFPYKREKERIEIENNKKMSNENMVKNEFKLIMNIGFAKRPYANLTNLELLKYNFTRDRFGGLKLQNQQSFDHKKWMSKTVNKEIKKKNH